MENMVVATERHAQEFRAFVERYRSERDEGRRATIVCELVAWLDAEIAPRACPHGRPTSIDCDVCSGRGIWEGAGEKVPAADIASAMRRELEEEDEEDAEDVPACTVCGRVDAMHALGCALLADLSAHEQVFRCQTRHASPDEIRACAVWRETHGAAPPRGFMRRVRAGVEIRRSARQAAKSGQWGAMDAMLQAEQWRRVEAAAWGEIFALKLRDMRPREAAEEADRAMVEWHKRWTKP